jgi:hypothetical protein
MRTCRRAGPLRKSDRERVGLTPAYICMTSFLRRACERESQPYPVLRLLHMRRGRCISYASRISTTPIRREPRTGLRSSDNNWGLVAPGPRHSIG